MKNIKSFTLIEVVVAVAIFATVLVIVFASFSALTSYQSKTQATRRVTEETKRVMNQIVQDLRWAKRIGSPNTNCLSIETIDVGMVCYCYNSGNITKQGIDSFPACSGTARNINADDIMILDFKFVLNNTSAFGGSSYNYGGALPKCNVNPNQPDNFPLVNSVLITAEMRNPNKGTEEGAIYLETSVDNLNYGLACFERKN